MKRFFFISIFVSLAGLLLTVFSFVRSSEEKDYSTCIKKYDSKWGDPCTQCSSYTNSYRVYLRNTCAETVDVKCAVQEADKRWRTFTKMKMAENDTLVGYACNGLGKYLIWARKTGDRMNEFPSDDEINAQYKK